jgi:hypothetical protein
MMEFHFNKKELLAMGVRLEELGFDLHDFLEDTRAMAILIEKTISTREIDIDPENDTMPETFLGNFLLFCYKYGDILEEIGSTVHLDTGNQDIYEEDDDE